MNLARCAQILWSGESTATDREPRTPRGCALCIQRGRWHGFCELAYRVDRPLLPPENECALEMQNSRGQLVRPPEVPVDRR